MTLSKNGKRSQFVTSMARHGLLLQRKCACGGTPGVYGECAECKQKSLQKRLSVGMSNDPLELEADLIADQVMAMPSNSRIRLSPMHIQRFMGQSSEEEGVAPPSVDRVLSNFGRPLEPSLRDDMERRFGYDFSNVRVHTGVEAEQSAREVNAHAYTVGNNIVFGTARYAPGVNEGRRLVAHELTHIVQQSQATKFKTGATNKHSDLHSASQNFHHGIRSIYSSVENGVIGSLNSHADDGQAHKIVQARETDTSQTDRNSIAQKNPDKLRRVVDLLYGVTM
jgi:hypothetical protein